MKHKHLAGEGERKTSSEQELRFIQWTTTRTIKFDLRTETKIKEKLKKKEEKGRSESSFISVDKRVGKCM